MDYLVYDTLISRATFIEGMYESKKQKHAELKDTVQKLKNQQNILEKVEKVFKFLMDKLANNDLSRMDKLISYGLNTVFPDRDINFKSELQEYGKKMKINLQTIYNGNPVDPSCKSSVHVIESFLLRILCINKLKKAKFLFMDEPFGAVDHMYIENVSQLIAELSEKLNMDILLVTHNPAFSEHVKNSYKISKKSDGIKVEKIK